MIHTIVVPLDGSTASEAVFPHVSQLFRTANAQIRLVQVYDWSEAGFRRGRDYLREVAKRTADRFPGAQTDLLKGEPAFEIMKYAVVHHADLIALTRGPSSLRRMLFGSTALELMRHSEIPLFMAHPTDSPRDIRRILVPVDGSRTSQGIFPVVADLARGAGARVTLLTVLSHEGNADPARRALERVGRSPTFARLPVDAVVRCGEAVPGILDSARAEGADVIALGTHGRTGSNRFFFGSVAEEVLSRAEVPVILRRTQKLPARMPRPVPLAHAGSSSSARESP